MSSTHPLMPAPPAREILETARDAFVSIDEGGLVIDWNARAQAVFGWSREQALGRELAETIVPEHAREALRERLRLLLAAVGSEDAGQVFEQPARHRDGREFPIEVSIAVLSTPDGRTLNAFLRDISERRHHEAELALAHADALDASRLKSEFVAKLSHKLRTPLTGVIGLNGLLLATALSDEQREYADGVSASGEVLMAVIEDILDFSRIEVGTLELDSESFQVRGLIGDVCSIVAGAAHSKGVQLVSRIDEGVPQIVEGDGNRIRQVVTNLLTNAVKFTSVGEVTIEVRGERDDADRLNLRFEVIDTGIGIEPASQELIFTSYGLAISKRLVALLGGELRVRSTPGQGSTFSFTVPVEAPAGDAPAPADGAVPAQPSEAAPAPAKGRAPGVWLLVAEDDPVNQIVAVRLLQKRGFHVEVAGNGRQALEMHARAPYDGIFMDCQMPEVDGYEATGEIRRREGAERHTPIVAMTASAMSGDLERCLAAGMDAYVGKPVKPEVLDDVIAETLGLSVADLEGPAEAAPAERDPEERPALLDRSLLADICGEDEEAISELVGLFLDHAQGTVEELARAVASGDAVAVDRAAHGLKGSAGVIGALRMAEISHELCEAARSSELSHAPRLQAELERSFEQTRGVLAGSA